VGRATDAVRAGAVVVVADRDPLQSFMHGGGGGGGGAGQFADRYELLECIGSGSFGTVWKARRRSDGVLVAVKKIDLGGMTDKARTETRNEVDSEP